MKTEIRPVENLTAMNVRLVLVENELYKLVKVENETKKLSDRQLQFRRDDAEPLCKKYFNKSYEPYKEQILNEISKKFENVKKRKEKTDKIYSTFEKFFAELTKEK
jgi:hypothetical protein